MTLAELKILLGVTDTTQDEKLQILLDSILDFIKYYCNNTFEVFPSGLKVIVADIIQATNNVKSEKIGNYSVDYGTQEDMINKYESKLRPYRKIKLV